MRVWRRETPILDNLATLKDYEKRAGDLAGRLIRRKQAACAFLDIMAKHSDSIPLEQSLFAWYEANEGEDPALYRAVPIDSSFGDAMREYTEKMVEEEKFMKKLREEHGRSCHKPNRSWVVPLQDKMSAAFNELPVCVALRAEFERRKCGELLEIVVDCE